MACVGIPHADMRTRQLRSTYESLQKKKPKTMTIETLSCFLPTLNPTSQARDH